jgi:pimeloyl-ACP methyl ester carboxylesterase
MLHSKLLTISALAASLLAFSWGGPARAQSAPAGVKNVVLVHGAFADGSSWAKIIPALQAKGLRVIAVQNPLTSLADDVAAARRAIAMMDGPVLLVGHSWGGVVITEAGNDPKVAGLVYVAALMPGDGQSVVDAVQGAPPAPGNAEYRVDAAGFQSLTAKGIDQFFAQDLPAAERKVIFATQGPWAKKATTEKVSRAAWKTKPSWSIVAGEDRMISPELQRARSKAIKATTLELKTSHVPMVSQPGPVAAFIAKAARQVPAGPKAVAAGK